MSIYYQNKVVAGVGRNTVRNAHNLLDFKWSDHRLNSMEWLESSSFSWQAGSVYLAAYNHLVADATGKTLQSETVGGVTVQFYLADDGHKICPANQESNVASIYSATGVAWYYIVDTTNERFKLPRVNPDIEKQYSTVPVSIYGNGSDIHIHTTTGGNANRDARMVYNNNEILQLLAYDGWHDQPGTDTVYFGDLNKQNVGLAGSANLSSGDSFYKGHKYLYFYVGQYTQSAIEQTAGITSEQLNDKISKTDASDKETVVGWGMPDYSNFTNRSWDTSYYADKDTFVFYNTNHQSGNPNVEPMVSSDNSNWIILWSHNAGGTNFKIGGWFLCPKGYYWKMVGGRDVDRMLKSCVAKGE